MGSVRGLLDDLGFPDLDTFLFDLVSPRELGGEQEGTTIYKEPESGAGESDAGRGRLCAPACEAA